MGNNRKNFWFKPGDIFVAVGILIFAVYIIVSSNFQKNISEHRYDGAGRIKKLILISGSQTIDLSWENNRIDLERLINRKMVVEIQNGKARIVSSSCPDKVCVHTGWVSECGHIAVCLPNGVALMIDCQTR